MKKGLIFLLILLLAFGACSCKRNKSIVGNWCYRDKTGNYKILSFFDDGSYRMMWGYKYKADNQEGSYGDTGKTLQIGQRGARPIRGLLLKRPYSITDFWPVQISPSYRYQIIGDTLYITGIGIKKPTVNLNGIYYRD